MGSIRTLPPEVVNQIAAGEVVERPASVVKELIENAIDAGATRIDVRISEGGKARIEVADDGQGMDEEDLAAAFLPHATSKLADVSDLEHIASLGFRGEALASVGSVSRASIVSRTAQAASGAVVEDRRGEVTPVRPAAAPPGTLVSVEGLFANVPARRKFLRSDATEAGHVTEAVIRFALAYPEIGFTLTHAGRTTVATEAGEGRLARIARFHGNDLAGALILARSSSGDGGSLGPLTVEGWISPPGHSRGDARLQQIFLNGRFIRDKVVAHAMREAYRDLVPPGNRHPVAFLFLSCDPSLVDVNVHPTKAEVRWRDSSAVHETVRRGLRAALEAARPGVPVPLELATGRCVPDSTVAAAEFAFTNGVGRTAFPDRVADSCEGHRHDHGPGGAAIGPPSDVGHMPASAAPRETLRPLGQALGTYLLFEAEDGIVVVDQHALHERVLFDRISSRLNETGRLEVQAMLVPAVVHLGGADAARVEEEKDLLATLGWHVEPFGDGAVAVHGCPAVLKRADPGDAFREVLSLLDGGRREGLDRAALVSTVLDRMACRSAVMAGDALHPDEVVSLLEQAERLNHAHSCPHGRPTRLRLSRHDLERHFHRIV